jgi:hypothetical protein
MSMTYTYDSWAHCDTPKVNQEFATLEDIICVCDGQKQASVGYSKVDRNERLKDEDFRTPCLGKKRQGLSRALGIWTLTFGPFPTMTSAEMATFANSP